MNNSNDYLKEMLERYKVDSSKFHLIIDKLKPLIGAWGSGYCEDIVIMGSIAHGTAIRKETDGDLDLMLSFSTDTPYSVEELYNSLYKYLKSKKYKVELRNISMRIQVNGVDTDVVPAIKQPGSNFHAVWSRRENRELQSNVQMHEDIIKQSNRQNEIKLTKIWLMKNNIKIDGIHLAFSILEALKDKNNDLSENMLTILKYFANKWQYQVFVDPARSSEKVSDNTEPKDIKKVVNKAKECLKLDDWNSIFNE